MTPVERARRFWTAHGRTIDDVTMLHAFASNPKLVWTPEGLSIWYGVRVDRARRIVAELSACAIVQPAGDGPGYRWNGAQDFAAPRDAPTRSILQERWITVGADGCRPPAGPVRRSDPARKEEAR